MNGKLLQSPNLYQIELIAFESVALTSIESKHQSVLDIFRKSTSQVDVLVESSM